MNVRHTIIEDTRGATQMVWTRPEDGRKRLPKQILNWTPQGRRKRGRPRKSWRELEELEENLWMGQCQLKILIYLLYLLCSSTALDSSHVQYPSLGKSCFSSRLVLMRYICISGSNSHSKTLLKIFCSKHSNLYLLAFISVHVSLP